MKFFIKSTLIFFVSVVLLAQTDGLKSQKYNDGPYLLKKENSIEALWMCDGEIINECLLTEEIIEFDSPCDSTDYKMKITTSMDLDTTSQFLNVNKFAAISDIHGQYDIFETLLTKHNIVDDKLDWAYGDGHFIINGDIFDRGSKVLETLWLIYKLEYQAERAGGKVHLLLGNHELMVLQGDLRYLHQKYIEINEKTDQSYDEFFSQKSILGNWLRSKNVIIKINDNMFSHAGISPELFEYKFKIEEINSIVRQNIDTDRSVIKEDKKLSLIFRTNGPIWFRGYFKSENSDSLKINEIFDHYSVNKIIVGHSTQETIISLHNKKIIAIDSYIKSGEKGEILLWVNDSYFRGKLDGTRTKLY